MLCVGEVKDIVVKCIIGKTVSSDTYSLGPTEQSDGSYPHLIVISTEGFSSQRFRDTACNKETGDPFYTLSSRFYTFDSIATHLNDDRLDEMIALCHVFITQEKNIMLLHRHGDKIIQTIYKVALDSCPVETDHVTQLTSDVKSFCDIIGRQFKKVVKEGDRKRQLKYAEDGANFTRQFKRKFVQLSDGIVVTPIESIANQESESVDLVFVKKIKEKQH
ncbi:hypothetical protein BDF21DRAFT_399365 [Thamnidium elegans]|nr:hypothetical protein BDF21DRAFT_399365 [Thamnidium elegans]